MPQWKVDIPTLQLALEAVQRYRRAAAREVAEEIGVPPSTLTRLKDGHRLDVDAFVSALEWLNMSHKRFIQRSDGSPAAEETEEMVTVPRRDVLLALSWAREALSGLSEQKVSEGTRCKIERSLQRLSEEIGPHLPGLTTGSTLRDGQGPRAPQPRSPVGS